MKDHFKLIASLITMTLLLCSCFNRGIGTDAKYESMIDQYVNYWNTGQFDRINNLLCEDFELRMTPQYEPELGIDAFIESVTSWRSAYPDFHIKIDEILYSNTAATVRWTITATNLGEGSHPPTGKRIEVPGISIFHFKSNKIKDEWIASNNYYWLQQLGFTLEAPSFYDNM